MKQACNDQVDMTGACFRCDDIGHHANICEASYRCAICARDNYNPNHKIGSDVSLNNHGFSRKTITRRSGASGAIN